MGDRTYASTEFRVEYYPLVLERLKKGTWDTDQLRSGDVSYGVIRVDDDQANYGEMSWLTNVLYELKIPYDIRWEHGGNYEAGIIYMRFTPEGESRETEVYEATEGLTGISTLLKKIKDGATIKEMEDYLEREAEQFKIYENQEYLHDIPIRKLTDEESTLIMKYKIEKSIGGVNNA